MTSVLFYSVVQGRDESRELPKGGQSHFRSRPRMLPDLPGNPTGFGGETEVEKDQRNEVDMVEGTIRNLYDPYEDVIPKTPKTEKSDFTNKDIY